MSRRRYLVATLSAGGLFATLFASVALLSPHPLLVWNDTASAPIGLYRLTATLRPSSGELVAVMPPPALARFLDARRYLPRGVPLLKHVAARAGDRICRSGARVSVNGRTVAIALAHDHHGRPLPAWRGCHVLASDELFLLNPVPDSMDGRYFGPLPSAGLLGRATPILTRDAPEQSLRWHSFGPSIASPQQRKG